MNLELVSCSKHTARVNKYRRFTRRYMYDPQFLKYGFFSGGDVTNQEHRPMQCSNCRVAGGLTPLPHLAAPPTSGKNSTPGGVEFQPPHLSFAEVGMLLDSHFLLMQIS